MRPIAQVFSELRGLQVRLFEESGQLKYHAPRGAMSHALLTELRERKSELLEFCRQAKDKAGELTLYPTSRDEDVALSAAQQRLWVQHLVEGVSAAYNIAMAVRLSGSLNLSALQSALSQVIQRHESLRTSFASASDSEEKVFQRIAATAPLPWHFNDLAHFSDRETCVKEMVREAARLPFDLAQAPLARFHLWRLSECEHVFLVSMHHIVSDGRSVAIFAGELSELYRAELSGEAAQLTPLEVQYADFAKCQLQWLESKDLKDQLNYWKTELQGLPPLLELAGSRVRPSVMSYSGSTLNDRLEGELLCGVRQLARKAGVTPFVVLLSLFGVLLSRYSGSLEIPIASPSSQRNRPELDGLIGFFVNTVVLRIDLSSVRSFFELLKRVKRTVAESFAHQDVPFDRVVESLAIDRNPGFTPVAQVSAMLLQAKDSMPTLIGLDVSRFDFDNPVARYDLTLEMYEREDELDLFWLYSTQLFEAEWVERLSRQMRNLTKAVLADPDAPLAQISILEPDERFTLLEDWSGSAARPEKSLSFPAQFEAQVERDPEVTAVISDGHRLTYRELNSRSNQLARYLAGAGVGHEQTVAVCARRSAELVVALLAVLKAGGAYVPLDPDYPAERLKFMTADCGPVLVLTQTDLSSLFPGRTVLCLDELPSEILTLEASNLQVPLRGDHLAYVIYTSGSTGRPKGCQLEHRNLAHYLGWASRFYYPEGTGGTFGLYTSLGFDLTITSLFLPLIRGGSVTLFPDDMELDVILRKQFDPNSGLDSIKITPAHLSLLASLELPPTQIELAIVGGDQLLTEQVRVLWAMNPNMRVFNEYGPTEATVGCIVKQLKPDQDRILIGKPIPGMTAYVLDDSLQPLPIGVAGELFLGGSGLARGYLGQLELTAYRFLRNPFRQDGRLYRTGDLVRWLPGGELECLGRIDNQVKIRGFRVELGEIEANLSQHPDIRQAAVIYCDGHGSGKHLVAFVEGDVESEELRGFLRERLPDFMLPQAWVVMEALPLNRHGKIDRKALANTKSAIARKPVVDLPRTPAEQLLAEIWAPLLGLDQVGIHDNFFELGGDSILSIQAASRSTQSGWKLTPKQYFQFQTIASLARVATPTVGTQPSDGDFVGEVPLSPMQMRFFQSSPLDPHHFNQALLLEIHRPWSLELLEEAFRLLLRHHDALRMRFGKGEGGWWQRCEHPEWFKRFRIDEIDLSKVPEQSIAAAITNAAAVQQTLLSLDGPLMRVARFNLGPQLPARILWVIHHLIVDGVSWRILLEDLLSACEQLGRGLVAELPAKTAAFHLWAHRQVEYANSDAERSNQTEWLKQMCSCSPNLPLPADHLPGDDKRALASVVRLELSRSETEFLLRKLPSVYRTRVNDALLTALVLAFSAWTGRDSLWVDIEGHGRDAFSEDLDLSRTVGWFTSIVPVCLSLGKSRDPGMALRNIKEQLRVYPAGGAHGLWSNAVGTENSRSLPRSEICFNYLGQVDQTLPEHSPFVIAAEDAGPRASLRDRLEYRLNVDGEVEGACLHFRFQYSRGTYHDATIEHFADLYLSSLKDLIEHCHRSGAGGVTPSDFPLAGLGQAQLDKLAKRLRVHTN